MGTSSERRQLRSHPLRGALFETLIVTELWKAQTQQGERPSLHFWRDKTGHEVDVLYEKGQQRLLVEIKSGLTVQADMVGSLDYWKKLADRKKNDPSWLVSASDEEMTFKGHRLIPWKKAGHHFAEYLKL